MGRRRSTRRVSLASLIPFPVIDSVQHVFLEDQSKLALQTLWNLCDKNGDGVLSAADFAFQPFPQRAQALWSEVQAALDLDRSGRITSVEFVAAFKMMAMAKPLDPSAFSKVPTNNLELLEQLQRSANTTVRTLAGQLFYHLAVGPVSHSLSLAPFWAERPVTALLSLEGLYITEASHALLEALFGQIDADGNGVLSVHDFGAMHFDLRASYQKWALLKEAFDANGDGVVSKEEFFTTFKRLALAQPLVGFNMLPSSHTQCMALLNTSTNAALGKLAEDLVNSIRSA